MAQITQDDRNNTIPSAVNDFLNWVTQQSPAAQNQQPQQQAPQQPANQSGPMETAFNAQQNSAVGPYQEGVLKGLRKAGEEHAYNAVSMGMDPNVMMQHPVMQGATQQGQTQTPVSNANPNPNTSQLNANTSADTTNQGTNMLAGLMKSMFNGNQGQNGAYISASSPLSLGGMTKNGQYEDQGSVIKVLELLATGRVPTGPEQASIAQQMNTLNPAQRATTKAGIYGTQIGALKDLDTSLGSEEERANTSYKNILDSRATYEKFLGVGKTNNILKSYKDRLDEIRNHRNLVQQKIGTTALTPPNIEKGAETTNRTGASVSREDAIRELRARGVKI